MATTTPADRIDMLQAEVDRLRAELARAHGGGRPPRHRWRSVWSALLITVACVLAPLSVMSVWARGEVTDTDRYLATVAPLAQDPAVQNAVSARITNTILDHLDVQAVTAEALDTIAANRELNERQRALLTALAGPISSGIESFATNEVTALVHSEAFAQAWTEANRIAHQSLVRALSGEDDGALALNGNAITLDLGQLIAEVKQRLVDRGFTVAERIPVVDTQLVLFQSDALVRTQNAYSALNALGYWLPLGAVTIGLVGVFVANRRRRAVIGLGTGLAIAMLVAGTSVWTARAVYLRNLPAEVHQDAATILFDTVVGFLRQGIWAGMTAALVLVATGILTGPSRLAHGVRGLGVGAASRVQGALYSWGATMTGLRRWFAHNATGLRIAAAIAAVAVVMLQQYKTAALVLWTTAGLLVVLFVIQVFASGVPAADDDPGTPQPAG